MSISYFFNRGNRDFFKKKLIPFKRFILKESCNKHQVKLQDSFKYISLIIFSELSSFMTLHLVAEDLPILGVLEIYFYTKNTLLSEIRTNL